MDGLYGHHKGEVVHRLQSVKRQTATKRKESFFCPYIKHWELFALFLPVLLYLLLFCYKPMVGVVIAFKNFKILKGIWDSDWVGLANFRKIIRTPSFFRVLSNTVKISLLRLVFGFPAPILFALLLNELHADKFKKVVQTISYLPHFLSWVILGGIFISFLSPTMGPIGSVMTELGLEPIFFLGDTGWFVPTLIVTGIWQSVGWGSIVYLAAISSVDLGLYEAAVLDGANRLQSVWHITIPSIMQTVTIMFILNMGNILNAGFDQIFNLYNDAVLSVSDIIDTYVYRRGLVEMDYSFSTAVGLAKNVIGFVFVVTTNAFTRRFSEYGLW